MSGIITNRIRTFLGNRLKENVALSRYTTSRLGGQADGLVEIGSTVELAEVYQYLLSEGVPCKVLGGGSNLLVSDLGYHGIMLINKSSEFHIERDGSEIYAVCESGVNLGALARKAALENYSGLEWAAGIPGSIGGAVYGNAGAHGSNMQSDLFSIELLLDGTEPVTWTSEDMQYSYRSSRLKRNPGKTLILKATLHGKVASLEEIRARMDEFTQKRKGSQPTGASTGSVFKNPANDFAGRLLESAGLKGTRIGGVEISQKHANFFINDGSATATDYYRLIRLAQKKVFDLTGIMLETEIELLGDFKDGE